MPADILTSPPPATAPAETPKESQALEVAKYVQQDFLQNLQRVRSLFEPPVIQAQQDVSDAQAEEARVQREVVAPAAEKYAKPRATPTLPQFAAQPPVRDISPRPFMDNPQAKDTLGNVVSLLGTMAQMAMAGRAPVAALNAFSGAMTGWAEGDRVRAQRQWSEYLATVDKINAENITAQRWYEDAMKDYGANELAARSRYVVALDQANLKERATDAAKQTMRDNLAILHHFEGEAGKLRDFSLNLSKYVLDFELKEEIKHQSRMHQLQQEQKWQEDLANKRRELGLKEREVSLKEKEASGGMSGISPEERQKTLESLADRFNAGDDVTQLVRGFGGKASNIMFEVQNIARQKAEASGDPTTIALTSRRILQSNVGALRKLTTQEAEFNTYVTTFEQTLAGTRRLVDDVEKSGMPVWDRKLLWLEAKVNGNPAANNLLAQMEVLARDTDRVLSRAKGTGAENSREQARQIMDPGLTSEQWHSLDKNVLSPDAVRAVAGFEVEKRKLMEKVADPLKAARQAISPPAAQSPTLTPPRPGMVRVKRKSDGATGWLEQKDLGDLYELVQ